ncbi:MAG TPA: acetylglutamate kinase [Candidatus Latescibacteria bacterium]|nr:acetylglutamate kinase [Candidatus Latescibacterota bacterium]
MDALIRKAEALIEALPYIRKFRGKVVVVKYGGSAMASRAERSFLLDLVFLETVGMRPVLVHGGGQAISKRMREEGIEAQFVQGLRVTDERTMEIVEETLFKVVNRCLVEGIRRLGGKAEGLSGKDHGILHVQRHRVKMRGREVDIGFVGDVRWVDPEPILRLCKRGVIPVVAPIGLGGDGRAYNVNADTAAGEIAATLKAEKLAFLTDVAGIFKDPEEPESLISTLSAGDVEGLIEREVISGGMIPKARACAEAVRKGVRKAHIVDGRVPHALLLEIFTDRGIGTEIVP